MNGSEILLDTNALSAFLADDPKVTAVVKGYRTAVLPVIAVGEFKFGILGSRRVGENSLKLRVLLAESIVLGIDEVVADYYAEARNQLRKIGRPIPQNDLWIAAIAIRHNLPLLSNDAHFRVIEGLDLKTW